MTDESQKEAKAPEPEQESKELIIYELEKLKAELKAAREEASKYREESELNKKTIESHESKVRDLESQVEEKSKELSSLKTEKDDEHGKNLKAIQDLRGEVNTISQEKESALAGLKKIQEESTYWKSSEESLTKQISELKRSLDEANTTSLFKCLNLLVSSMVTKQQGSI